MPTLGLIPAVCVNSAGSSSGVATRTREMNGRCHDESSRQNPRGFRRHPEAWTCGPAPKAEKLLGPSEGPCSPEEQLASARPKSGDSWDGEDGLSCRRELTCQSTPKPEGFRGRRRGLEQVGELEFTATSEESRCPESSEVKRPLPLRRA